MDFTLRACVPGDETALALVARGTILETYAGVGEAADVYVYVDDQLTVQHFAGLLADRSAKLWIEEAQPGGIAVGYALVRSEDAVVPFATSELKRLYVFSRFHGAGLGARLLDVALEHAREAGTNTMFLRVHEANDKAKAFYLRYGFMVTGEEPFRAGGRDYRVFRMERTISCRSK